MLGLLLLMTPLHMVVDSIHLFKVMQTDEIFSIAMLVPAHVTNEVGTRSRETENNLMFANYVIINM